MSLSCSHIQKRAATLNPSLLLQLVYERTVRVCMSGVQFPSPGKVVGEGWRSGGASVGSPIKGRKACLRVVCELHIWLSLALVPLTLSRVALSVAVRT